MKFLVRADASAEIGTGHIMRCLTLAEMLKERSAEVVFVCRDEPQNLISFIKEKGFECHSISGTSEGKDFIQEGDAERTLEKVGNSASLPDWVVVDHYKFDHNWEKIVREQIKKIFVIDDLADRFHVGNVLLDQNFVENYETRYDRLVPKNCKKFLGPAFALLRPEFLQAAVQNQRRNKKVENVLICFGGADPTNETGKTIKAISEMGLSKVRFTIAAGKSNPRKNELKRLCSRLSNFTFFEYCSNMAQMMAEADLAIGAGGTSSWERCFMGLPCIMTITAPNQQQIVESLAKAGAGWNLGFASDVTPGLLAGKLNELLTKPEMVYEASKRASEIVPHGSGRKFSLLLAELLGKPEGES